MAYSLKHFHHPKKANYSFNCQLIDVAQIIQGLGLLVYYRSTYNITNLNPAIQAIQKQLKEFEVWLLNEEQSALLAIKNKYNIDNEIWHSYMIDTQELKDIYTNAYQQSWNVKHDTTIAPNIRNIIEKVLLKNNIDPQSINIKKRNVKKSDVIAQVALNIDFLVDSSNNRLIFTKQYQPPTLRIFSQKNSTKAPHVVMAIYAHEIQHIVQKHGLTKQILKSYLNHYYHIDEKTIDTCPEFQHLIQIHEAQAEVLSTIKDPEIASSLRMYRKKNYYPQYLYEEHYYNISTADMLWKVESWLTWFNQNSCTNIGNNLIAKMQNLAESFKQSFTC